MSFMDEIGKVAGIFGGASPDQAAQAAQEHVGGMDPDELGGHLQQSLGSMDGGSLMALGQQLLQAYEQHGSGAAQAAETAGTDPQAVAAGDPGAIGQLLELAKSHPQVIQMAASHFLGSNPGAIGQLAPGLLQGILGRLGG